MPEPLPDSREARRKIIERSTDEYLSRMGPLEVQKLLTSLSRTKGLSDEERREDDRWNVAREYLPDYLRYDH